MKHFLLLGAMLFATLAGFSQKRYFTKTGNISFNAGTSMEDIDGANNTVTSVLDVLTGQIEFAVLVKGFEFKRALMQEHFNENYMESDKFPKAIFKGKIIDLDKVNFQKNGSYPVTVKGTLEMHGVKKDIETTATLKVSGETIAANAGFPVILADYNIAIPSLVKDKISKTANVTVSCNYTALK